jgi:hypothetical protein
LVYEFLKNFMKTINYSPKQRRNTFSNYFGVLCILWWTQELKVPGKDQLLLLHDSFLM